MDKSDLREAAISTLKKISDTDKMAIERKLLSHLIHTTAWKNAHAIGITISKGFEWDTSAIIETAWSQNKTIYAPKCYPKERKLVFHKLQSFQELEIVYYNLLEPKPTETNRIDKNELDIVVVPGLIYDTSGFRVGFGGGYYDRFLADYEGPTIALTSTELLTDHIPKEKHDIAVQQIITESGTIKC